MKEENLYVLILLVVLPILYVPTWIKTRIIKHKHSLQLRAIQAQTRNPLQTARHPKLIETQYSILTCFAFGSFMFAFVFIAITMESIINEYIKEQHYQFLINYILPYTLFFYLLDLAVFYIRMARGCIQGAIIFDPQEKKIYAFPSLNSDYYLGGYKEYQESELVYTKEKYPGGFYEPAYVFFTRKNKEYAFKVGDLEENNFGEMLSQYLPANIPIPIKYDHYSNMIILLLVSLFLFLLNLIWIVPSLPKAF